MPGRETTAGQSLLPKGRPSRNRGLPICRNKAFSVPYILTYLKLTGLKVGLLINFNVPTLRGGTKRLAN